MDDYSDTILPIGCVHFRGKSFGEIWGTAEVAAVGISGREYLRWMYVHHMRLIDPKPDFYATLGTFLRSQGVILFED